MSIEANSLAKTLEWIDDGRPLAIATLVDTEGSSPLEVGSMMLIDDKQNVEGSVTGGCVEGALVDAAGAVLGGEPPRVRTFGCSDDLAGSVGLMCGGTVHIFVERIDGESRDVLSRVLAASLEAKPSAVATVLDGDESGARLAIIDGMPVGTLGPELLDSGVVRDTKGMLEQGISGIRRYGAEGASMGSAVRVAVRSFAKPRRMIIFGAIDYSVATAILAAGLGYSVTIVDPREPFVRSSRFTEAAEVVVDWPDHDLERQRLSDRDLVLVFSHDPKIDQPALIAALASGAGYVGALGSRRTHAARVHRLRQAGVAESEMDRIAAPCGLDIGARTPAETAVSILAETIAVRSSRPAQNLSRTDGPIHSETHTC